MGKRFFIISAFILFLLSFNAIAQDRIVLDKKTLPPVFQKSVGRIAYDKLGKESGKATIRSIDKNTLHVTVSYSPDEIVHQNDWQINLQPAFVPSFHWSPHLTPTDNHVIDQHVFRSPTLIVADKEQVIALIPDLNMLQKGTPVRWYLDLDAETNTLTLGMSNSRVVDHVLFERTDGAEYTNGKVEIGFYLLHYTDKASLADPFRKPLEFLWKNWGSETYRTGNPVRGDLEPYIKHTYDWAFKNWSESVWQEFEIEGRKVGAPAFIVNVTQSPNYPGEVNEREFRSVWNQAWFSSLRSASGLYRYARRTNNGGLLEKARLTKELDLSFPQKNGFFYGVIGTDMYEIEIDGRKYNRSKGWDTYYWGNSNRNPYTWNPRESPFHILDMSWTALLMLRWY
ncbi:MAG: hypothetical protein VB054_06705, partial [Petrimonas sp.]|nr:hypothetical protein [Petrimonas sp.]